MTTFEFDTDKIDPGTSVERRVDQLLLNDAIRLVLDSLSAERREVLALYFGLGDGIGANRGAYTTDEISRLLNISRERVIAVRNTTLIRLRQQKEATRRLTPFMHLLFVETPSSHTIDFCHEPGDET